MPYTVHKGAGLKPYKIISKMTGHQVGSSTSMAKAKSSMNARMASEQNWDQQIKPYSPVSKPSRI